MNTDLLIVLGLFLACLVCVFGFLGMLTNVFFGILIGVMVAVGLAIKAILIWILVAFARFLDRAARK